MFKIFRNYLSLIKNRGYGIRYLHLLPENPRHDDIYIVEYPKSGVTYLSFLIGNIELRREGLPGARVTFFNKHKYIPDVHLLNNVPLRRLLKNTFIKSHANYRPEYGLVIYLIRNPFNVMVSFYNYMLGFGYKDSFEDFIRSPVLGIDAWICHVKSWTKIPNTNQKIILVKYEDLVNATKETLVGIYGQIGVALDKSEIDIAIGYSSMDSMKRCEDSYSILSPVYARSFVGSLGKLAKEDLLTSDAISFMSERIKGSGITLYDEFL